MIDLVASNGWSSNLRVRNDTVELIITLEVGPRILSYAKPGGANPFKIFADQVGRAGEAEWRNRGGHRLWIAPEHHRDTYVPDNAPVAWEKRGELSVRLTPPPEAATGLQKQIDLTLDPQGTGVSLVHRITRTAATPATLAPWALTVMAPGGVAVVPQPPLGEHPRDLLPNRNVVLWPYTDLADPRFHLGSRYWLLRQNAARGPTKIGFAQQNAWCGYIVDGVFFRKTFSWQDGASYVDGGCNCELFTNQRMLELESLGPLTRLTGGESVEHTEKWELHDAPAALARDTPDAIASFVDRIVPRAP